MYYVFDCTRSTGYTAKVPFKWMALVVAEVCTKWTCRYHDCAATYGDMLNGIGR